MYERKVVFLDKDGTLIPDVPYNVNPDLVSLEPGVVEGLKLLKKEGYIFVVISNQAGVARGYFQINELEKVKQKIDLLLNTKGIEIEKYYFCPHHTDGKVQEYTLACECRKPKPGMILQATKDLEISVVQSWMIGDILHDAEAGNRAGCRSIVINNGNETEWVEGPFRTPTYIAENFLDAAKFICANSHETKELNDTKLAAL
ncbi:HAD family hydrolase [Segetibacter sp.]|jgi:D-glycero-D-manno-heptose 1,7-bisphosphate phosphatase|uniref:D-glycero-alpha-D-manno-heptose-1,7-bisphosphate 7-phosphatase n=1 Tax=Segetibacter sp. TaxID=2231182 RepID=UPI002607121F|nr:HAD family hydrolase [Segetibacter sp.]MCW3080074.1 hydrolase, HAD-superfamily, subfamily [Segetibacter sp.]